MKHTLYIILSACLLSLNACTSDDLIHNEENNDSEVRLMATIDSENSSRAEIDDNKTLPEGIKKNFILDDKIHFVNTYQFEPPQYNESAVFTCTGEAGTDGCKFTRGGNDLTWNNFKLTSLVYIFEAAYYPDWQKRTTIESPLLYSEKKVYSDQSSDGGKGFFNSDLLLAHNRVYIKDKYKDIKLIFHHAFAMVRVIAKVGINQYGGIPENAIQSAKLVNIQREYYVDYSQAIQNNALRTVTGNGEVYDDVTMWNYKTTITNTNGQKEQTYIFYAIIPKPRSGQIQGDDFLHFEIKDKNEDISEYRFVPDKAIPLEQGYITTLKLVFSKEGSSPLLLYADIQPWKEASQDMELGPEDTPSAGENVNDESGNENM